MDRWRQVGCDSEGRAVFLLPLAALDGQVYSDSDVVGRAAELVQQAAVGGATARGTVWILDATGAKDQKSSSPALVSQLFPREPLGAKLICILPNNWFQRGLKMAASQHAHLRTVVFVHEKQFPQKFPEYHALVSSTMSAGHS